MMMEFGELIGCLATPSRGTKVAALIWRSPLKALRPLVSGRLPAVLPSPFRGLFIVSPTAFASGYPGGGFAD